MSVRSPSFDPWSTFHESAEEQQAIKERAKFRDAMKAEYRKKMSNPFKPPHGVLHDPALQRWYSARVTYAEYLQPSPKIGLMVAACFGVFGLLFFGTRSFRTKTLGKIERGELNYKERTFAFLTK